MDNLHNLLLVDNEFMWSMVFWDDKCNKKTEISEWKKESPMIKEFEWMTLRLYVIAYSSTFIPLHPES